MDDFTFYIPRFLHVHRNIKTAEGRGPGSACESVFQCGTQKPVQHLQPSGVLLRLLLPHVWKTYRWVPISKQHRIVTCNYTFREWVLWYSKEMTRLHSSLCIILKVNEKWKRSEFLFIPQHSATVHLWDAAPPLKRKIKTLYSEKSRLPPFRNRRRNK